MSDKEKITNPTTDAAQQQPAKAAAHPEDPSAKARSSVRMGSLIVFLIIGFSLVWYLLADRYTPTTTQARLQGYIVGVAPKVGGVVTEVWVKNNQEVTEGQPLFQIDQSQYRIALDKALSGLENTRRQVDAGTAAVEMAQANVLATEANAVRAEQDFNRLARLREEDPGTISVRRLEIAEATLEQSRAAVVAAKANVSMAIEQKGGMDDQNNSIVKSATLAVEEARLDLANTTVTATAKGIITDLQADVGQYAGAGSPVLTLISINDLWINAEFTENNLGHMQKGSPVEILFDSQPGEVFIGKVRSIGLGVSAGNSQPAGSLPSISNDRDWLRQAQRFPVEVGFDPYQKDALLQHLRIGGQATVIAYPEQSTVLNFLGRRYIRLKSFFSYAY